MYYSDLSLTSSNGVSAVKDVFASINTGNFFGKNNIIHKSAEHGLVQVTQAVIGLLIGASL